MTIFQVAASGSGFDPTQIFQIVSTIGGILGLAVGTPGIILFLLNRRNANKKLEIAEDKLTVDQFNAALPAYKDLLDRANKATFDSLKELASYKAERIGILQELSDLRNAKGQQDEELTKTNDKLELLRTLVERYVARTGVPMTTDEIAIFDDTKPLVRRPRRTRTVPPKP